MNLNTNDQSKALSALPVLNKYDIVQSYCDKLYYSDFKSFDSLEYSIHIDHDMGGYSGSPVYLFYRNKIVFGGLISSGSMDEKHAEIVRPQYVLDKLH